MKNKLTALLLIVTLLLSFTGIANASAKVSYSSITATGTLNTIGESTLSLSQDFSADKAECITLIKSDKLVSAELIITGKTLTLSPSDYLEGNYNYTVKIITHNDKKYTLTLTAKDTYSYDPLSIEYLNKIGMTPWGAPSNEDIIMEIAPKPSKGFNYSYLLLIPNGTTDSATTKYMIVESNNDASPSNSLEFHEEGAKIFAHAFGDIRM